MKKLLASILCAALLLSMGACGAPVQSSTPESDAPPDSSLPVSSVPPESEAPPIADKGLFDVEITLPASLFQPEQLEAMKSNVESQGAKDITVNDDGSISFKISKDEHEKMMKEYHKSVADTLDALITNEQFTSFKDVEYNDDFSKVTLTIDRAAYEGGLDKLALLAVTLGSPLYQSLNGQKEVKLAIELKDETTGEIFLTQKYPEEKQ